MTTIRRAYLVLAGGALLSIVAIMGYMTQPNRLALEIPIGTAGMLLLHLGRRMRDRARGED